MFGIILVLISILSCDLLAQDQRIDYFIRQAVFEDKQMIMQLYEKSASFLKDHVLESRFQVRQIVNSYINASIDEGFAFVVQTLPGVGMGQIVAFLMKNRPVSNAYRHVVDQGIFGIDPHFRNELLLTQLYRYVQNHIESYYPDILRMEGCCSVQAYDQIAMFESCGFRLEGVRSKSVRLFGGGLADELCFVWLNRNFAR